MAEVIDLTPLENVCQGPSNTEGLNQQQGSWGVVNDLYDDDDLNP